MLCTRREPGAAATGRTTSGYATLKDSASGRCAIDEQSALADDTFTVTQSVDHFNHLAIGLSGLDFPLFDRLVASGDPDMGRFSVVHDRFARHAERAVAFGGDDRDVREHLGAQE